MTTDPSPGLPDLSYFLSRGEPGPSASNNPSRVRWTVEDLVLRSLANANVATVIQPGLWVVPPAPGLICHLGRNGPPLLFPESQIHAVDEVETHPPSPVMLPQLSIPPPRPYTRIPPEPHITLLSLGSERLQLSDAALGELDMKLYVSRVY